LYIRQPRVGSQHYRDVSADVVMVI